MAEPYKVVRTYEYQETVYFDSEGVEVATDRHEFSDAFVSEEAPEPCEQWEIDDYDLEADSATDATFLAMEESSDLPYEVDFYVEGVYGEDEE